MSFINTYNDIMIRVNNFGFHLSFFFCAEQVTSLHIIVLNFCSHITSQICASTHCSLWEKGLVFVSLHNTVFIEDNVNIN